MYNKKVFNMEYFLKYIFIFLSMLMVLNASERKVDGLHDVNLTKIEVPIVYKDYMWDIGVIGGLTFDGIQIDYKRYTIGGGVHAAYHLNDTVSFHGEYVRYFKSFADSKYNSDAKKIVEEYTPTNIVALSVAYDFTADRSYSLFVKGGFGYEFKENKEAANAKAAVSLLGLGFRYMFTDHISGYLEGRWKMRLTNISETDNSLIGTVGLDYHFGLSDEKAKLIAEADAHNAQIDKLLEERAEAKHQKELSKQ